MKPVPSKRAGNRDEFYSTDIADVKDFFHFAMHWGGGVMLSDDENYGDHLLGRSVLDPCAGGSLNTPNSVMPYAETAKQYGAVVDTLDIRNESLAWKKGDFINDDLGAMFGKDQWDLIVSNPPFSMYRKFVEKALKHAKVVCFLLPLQVTEPRIRTFKEDIAWWKKHKPMYCLEHKRLKFGGSKASAFQQYGHFIWFRDKCRPGTYHLSVHDLTDIESNGLTNR